MLCCLPDDMTKVYNYFRLNKWYRIYFRRNITFISFISEYWSIIVFSSMKRMIGRIFNWPTDQLTNPQNAPYSSSPPLVYMFQRIDFSIAFSWKIYPEILDFRFSILYLCSVESSPRSTQSSTKFFYLPLTTNGEEGSREHPLRKLRYAFEILRYATLHSGWHQKKTPWDSWDSVVKRTHN